MKKILFVIPTISCGGAERALVELLKNIDYSEYDVDLMLFRKDDMYYLNQIPKEVNILENDEETKLAFDHVKHLIKSPLFIKKINVVLYRIWETANFKIRKFLRIKKYYYNWKRLKKFVPKLNKRYDCAVGCLEGNSIYYIIDKVEAKKKIGSFHTSYIKGGFNKNFDLNYFKKNDCILTVCEEISNEIIDIMPEIKDKVKVMYNIMNVDDILSKSNEIVDFDESYDGIKILSIGNLRYVKGYDISIKACKILKDKNYKFKWYILGEGKERRNIENLIKKYNLQNYFILLGLITNPYAYLNKADIYVQTSRHEGLSTTIREAKLLAKPIVITDCPGMRNQIKNKENGTITSYDPEDIANKIAELIDNKQLKQKYIDNLKKNGDISSTEEQMKIFYRELENK